MEAAKILRNKVVNESKKNAEDKELFLKSCINGENSNEEEQFEEIRYKRPQAFKRVKVEKIKRTCTIISNPVGMYKPVNPIQKESNEEKVNEMVESQSA